MWWQFGWVFWSIPCRKHKKKQKCTILSHRRDRGNPIGPKKNIFFFLSPNSPAAVPPQTRLCALPSPYWPMSSQYQCRLDGHLAVVNKFHTQRRNESDEEYSGHIDIGAPRRQCDGRLEEERGVGQKIKNLLGANSPDSSGGIIP
jgi:hypothetical protein